MLFEVMIVTLLLYSLYRYLTPQRPSNFPPGPKEYPLAGGAYVISKLDSQFPLAMTKLGDIYGPVTGIYLGMMRSLVINGYETVQEVLTRDEFQGRPKLSNLTTGGRKLGLIFADGELWKDQRRFTLRHLRDFGFGKSSMESIVQEEIQELLLNVKKKMTESPQSIVAIHEIFGPPIINVLWVIMTGKRHHHDDPEFLQLLHRLNRMFRSGNSGSSLINDWPFLRFLPYFSGQYKELMDGRKAVLELLKKQIQEHIATREDSFSRDFLDVYLKEIEEVKKSENVELKSYYCMDQLHALCNDLFGAGAETTSNTVAFAMLYMILYHEVQEKVQDELDRVVGKDRLPSYTSDRASLPYLEAVLCEVIRMSGTAPLTVPHCTTQDTKLHGYDIPKDTFILVVLASVHNDKSYWGDPEKFRPERFIDSQGKLVKTDHLMGFGYGKRICLGESLARMTNFDFFAAMMQSFKVELAPGTPRPSTIPTKGFTVAPQPFVAKLTLR